MDSKYSNDEVNQILLGEAVIRVYHQTVVNGFFPGCVPALNSMVVYAVKYLIEASIEYTDGKPTITADSCFKALEKKITPELSEYTQKEVRAGLAKYHKVLSSKKCGKDHFEIREITEACGLNFPYDLFERIIQQSCSPTPIYDEIVMIIWACVGEYFCKELWELAGRVANTTRTFSRSILVCHFKLAILQDFDLTKLFQDYFLLSYEDKEEAKFPIRNLRHFNY